MSLRLAPSVLPPLTVTAAGRCCCCCCSPHGMAQPQPRPVLSPRWALGVVLYQLLQGGAWPFKHCWWPWQKGGGERMEAAIRRAVLAGRITFQGGAARVSEPLRALIRGLLQPDPNRRWQLRQVLAAEAVRPELLARLGQRFPELEPDMQALLQLQRRARDVQALGSDGGIAAGGGGGAAAAASLATAGSVLVAAASTVLRGGVSVVVEGALHWPHWPGGGRGGEPGAGGGDGDGSSYRPLLDVEDQEAPAAAAAGEELPARSGGPSALLTAPATEARPSQQQQQHAQQPKQQKSTGAPVADLLLLFPNELPDAHPPPPGSLRVYPPPPPTANTGGAGAAAAALSPVGLAPTASVFSGDQEPLASGRTLSGGAAAGLISTTSSGAVGAAGIHHALTTTSLNARADAGSDIAARGPSDASGPASGGDGPDGRRQPGSHPHSLRLSRRSLTGSPLRGTSQLGAPPHSPSPRSRRSRTSLHDLFGAPCASLQLQGPPSLLPQPHQRPPSGPGLGGLLGTATEYLSGGGAASGGHHPRGSWTLPRRSPPLLEPLDAGAEGEEAEQAAILPQSSWVPPPPEAIAAAAAAAAAADAASRRGDGSGTARLAAAGRAAAAGTGSGPGAVAPQGSGGDPHAQPHLHSHQHQHQQHQQQRHHRHSGLIARARRLFADCLLRPGGKYDMYECDEYDTLPEPAPVPGKAQ
ncbi:hypothetical protein PLESTB_001495900 [Pleodorina starrii]|uniref:Protein kinase domain-containing protein n=1 Tax=Pleodorina starrii TaxID=330485 RepID=A0A9W6F7T8_9CHLO|nr:hypothetical protein PLESTB_001495900 [Pleodorina starrii]